MNQLWHPPTGKGFAGACCPETIVRPSASAARMSAVMAGLGSSCRVGDVVRPCKREGGGASPGADLVWTLLLALLGPESGPDPWPLPGLPALPGLPLAPAATTPPAPAPIPGTPAAAPEPGST